MLVSVIVPTYNRAHLIVRTLESIIGQTYQDIEIIVVDDGSTDNTEQVVKEISSRTNRPLRYHKKLNGGCSSARNLGIRLAGGDAIAFLDSDDIWVTTAAEALMAALTEAQADYCYSPAIEVYKDRSEINYPAAAGRPDKFAEEHFMSLNVRNGAQLFRREVFDRVGLLDESLKHNEDSDFLQRVAISCKAAYCDVPTVMILHHASNKSGNRVALMRAVLKSSEKILAENPNFGASLGRLAEHRIAEIKASLVEELVIAGEFDQAETLAAAVRTRLSISVKLALVCKLAMFVKAANFCCILKRFLFFHTAKFFRKNAF